MSTFFVTLKNRGLIHLEGPDRHDFLQGLITNDVKKLTPEAPLYACLLNAQGKFLHDFFVLEGNNFILLDCEGGERAQDLYKRLNMYRLRSDVQVSVEETNTVYATPSSRRKPGSGYSNPRDPGLRRDDICWQDPRHEALGYRSFQKPDDLEERPFEDWDYLRISLCIPDGSRDLIVGKSTMDEARMDQLNAIDYDKGCYVGQELTARMHYRGLGKKHLQTVKLDAIPEKAELRSYCRDIGIALVRD